jgi:hypothetical protein
MIAEGITKYESQVQGFFENCDVYNCQIIYYLIGYQALGSSYR